MRTKGLKKVVRIVLRTLAALLLLVLLLIVAIYIPPVQDALVPVVLEKISDDDGLAISVDKFRLTFPATVKIEGLALVQKGDTMLAVGDAYVDASLLRLLRGEVHASQIAVRRARFTLGTPDSATYLRARLDSALITSATMGIGNHKVDIDRVRLDAARVSLDIKNDTTPPSPPSEDSDWHIRVKHIEANNVAYDMTLEETIERLGASLGNFSVDRTEVNLKAHTVRVADVGLNGIDAEFVLADTPAPDTEVPPDTFPASVPWDVRVAHLDFRGDNHGLFAIGDAKPGKGFNPDYIEVRRLTMEVDSFVNRGVYVRVPLRRLFAAERCGLTLDASGVYTLDSVMMTARDFRFRTQESELSLDALYMTEPPASRQKVTAKVTGAIAPNDVSRAFPDISPVLGLLPEGRKIDIALDLDGTLDRLHLSSLAVGMQRHFELSADGDIEGLTDFDNAVGRLKIKGNMPNVNFLKPLLSEARRGASAPYPALTLHGSIDIDRGHLDGSLKALSPSGEIALEGEWNNRYEGYGIGLSANSFPLGAFLPGSGLGIVSMTLKAEGRGLDFTDPRTTAHIVAKADDVRYNGHSIHDLLVEASAADGLAEASLVSTNPVLKASLHAAGNLAGEKLKWHLDADIPHADLRALGISDSVSALATRLHADADIFPESRAAQAALNVDTLAYTTASAKICLTDLLSEAATSDSITSLTIDNHDLHLRFRSPLSLSDMTGRFVKGADYLTVDVLRQRRIDVDSLQEILPPFTFSLEARSDNVLQAVLNDAGISVGSLVLKADNDSTLAMTLNADNLTSGETVIDHASLIARQRGKYLRYRINIDNEPGTMDDLAHLHANGYLSEDNFSVFLQQQDIEGETGYNFGAVLAASDSTISLKFAPYYPTIAYKYWSINPDNFVVFNTRTHHLDANLEMKSNESSLHLYTIHDSIPDDNDDIVLKVDKIKIQDWIKVNPFAPPVKGDLSADLRIDLAPGRVDASGIVELDDFFYGRRRVGSFGLGIDITTDRSGLMRAESRLSVDGNEVLLAHGALNDSTRLTPVNLELELTRFPLMLANPFIEGTAQLNGYLGGEMKLTGTPKAPVLNGALAFDSATAKVNMLGTTFRISPDPIAVDSNLLALNNLRIFAVNDNPLALNGTVDFRRLSNMLIDLNLHADNMQLIGSDKSRRSQVYGKAFLSLDANAKGSSRFVNVDAALTLLEGSNFTYILDGGTTDIADIADTDMVKFVNFSDTTAVLAADSAAVRSTAINLEASLTVAQGATVGVDLGRDGNNRVQLQPNGTISYSLSPMGDSRVVGRINIPSGFVRYTPPAMSEKLFNIAEGSYATWNGLLENPTLRITAIDRIRANVTQEGQNSRLIWFDVAVNVGGTPSDLDVSFDLSTDDDVTVENELQAMSADQRANQAMNLLLYSVYTGPGTKGNANLSGNILYSFLESTLNSWMSNNIKIVDISFGIDQYNRTVDGASTLATSYSYQVSKSLFDDRFKIVVGGNYTTDAQADETFSENLISDISFEYMLNKAGTMYVRLFRHNGYESILEGEITQTGVGFVFKRKLRTLRHFFRKPDSESSPIPQQGSPIPVNPDKLPDNEFRPKP